MPGPETPTSPPEEPSPEYLRGVRDALALLSGRPGAEAGAQSTRDRLYHEIAELLGEIGEEEVEEILARMGAARIVRERIAERIIPLLRRYRESFEGACEAYQTGPERAGRRWGRRRG